MEYEKFWNKSRTEKAKNIGLTKKEVTSLASIVQKESIKVDERPCSDLILKYKIKNVVIGSIDPNKTVKGGGIEKLESNGCNVTYGILKNECDYLNKRFFTSK